MIIRKLYSEGNLLFAPITFEVGFNLILGDRSTGSEKRNGVGKTVSIEFLNFMLLNDLDKSRLKKIPLSVYKDRSIVCLDLEISNKSLTVQRDLIEANEVIFKENGVSQTLDIANARKLLLSKMEFSTLTPYSTFRELLSPLTRDERCEFKSIPKYSDTNVSVPINFMPHLFYLGIDGSSLKTAMELKETINADMAVKKKIKQQLETLSGKDIGDSRVELNKLTEEKNELSKLINRKDYSVFDMLDERFQTLNIELKQIRSQLSSKKLRLKQIGSLRSGQQLDIETVELIYTKVRQSLASEVSRSLNQVVEFKNKISSYTNNVISKKSVVINKEVKVLEERRTQLLTEREQFEKIGDDVEYNMKEAVGRLVLSDNILDQLLA